MGTSYSTEFNMIAAFAVLCLAQLSFGAPQYVAQPYGYGYPTQYYGYPYAGAQVFGGRQTIYAAPVAAPLRPEDAAAIEELGPDGVETGKEALNVAGNLVKGVFPANGPIIQNGLYKPSGVLMLFLTLKMLKSLRISYKLL